MLSSWESRKNASFAIRTKLWDDRFKQLHPHEPYLIWVRANIAEAKDVLMCSRKITLGCVNRALKGTLLISGSEAVWGPLSASFHLSIWWVVSGLDGHTVFTNLDLILATNMRTLMDKLNLLVSGNSGWCQIRIWRSWYKSPVFQFALNQNHLGMRSDV